MTWIQEWMGGAKGKAVHNYLSQIETLSKVNGWMDEGFMTAILQGLALEFLSGQELVRDGCSYENLKRALVDSVISCRTNIIIQDRSMLPKEEMRVQKNSVIRSV